MIYVGMDISSKSFVVRAIDDRKKVVFKGEIRPTRAGLRELIRQLGPKKKLVVFEAGNQMKWIALMLEKIEGVEVHVVHPNEVKWITQSNGKNDKVDAKKLAELARADMLPRRVHIVEGKVRKLRELASARHTLQSKRVALITTIRGYVLQEGRKLPEKFFDRKDWYEQLQKKKFSKVLKDIIGGYRVAIEALKKAEAELTDKMLEIEDKRIEQLESIPGIGKISSRVLWGAIDEASRFDNQKTVAKYGGLTPTLYQSGDVTHRGHINRNGRHEVRRVLLQCAHTVVRMKSVSAKPFWTFFERIQNRRGKKIAIVAVARKLLTTAYAVLKHKQMYDPSKLLPESAKKTGRIYKLQRAA